MTKNSLEKKRARDRAYRARLKNKNAPDKTDIISELVSVGASSSQRWNFSEDALEDIAKVKRYNKSGKGYFTAPATARVLKTRYDLAPSVSTIAKRLKEDNGGSW